MTLVILYKFLEEPVSIDTAKILEKMDVRLRPADMEIMFMIQYSLTTISGEATSDQFEF